ncbi:helix-turn-helix transcriptional regulator [Azospirillum endophyticum]
MVTTLSEAEVAALLGLSPKRLRVRRQLGDAPAHVRVGRRAVYLSSDVEAWLLARRVSYEGAATVPDSASRKRGRPRGSITRRQRGEG